MFGEVMNFKLNGTESFNAKLFRSHHKRQGCRFHGLFRGVYREVQKKEPMYTYIFEQISPYDYRKYIRCNVCGEQTEITEKKYIKD